MFVLDGRPVPDRGVQPAVAMTVSDERISEINLIVDREKLAHVRV